MKNVVLYFTRTGGSKRVAEIIAAKIGVNAIEITDNKNWNGVLGYIKAGFYSSFNKNVPIIINEVYEDADQYIVISPIWAGGPAPAVKEFIKLVKTDKVNLVLTCLGSDTDVALTKFETKFGKLKGKFGIVKKLNNEEKIIAEIVKAAQATINDR